ncbi:hypothetical protein G6011_02513 [Alternaria panax]|uniref:Ankyrin n=1 Tax=Alternaria panax TaxID=48097 RepID=A0AAD4FA19_9PLEO|nr:hypothetical protein G6011_02513 [Alternaria panax]
MDPLSIAGSVSGLISLSDAVYRRLYHYVKDVRNAEKEVKDLKDEVGALSGVLHNLDLIAQDLENRSLRSHSIGQAPGHIKTCISTLKKLLEKLNKVIVLDKGKFRAAMDKLKWPFKAGELKQFIEDIRGHRDNLSFALSADTMEVLLQCLSKQDDLLSGIASIENSLRNKEEIETKIVLDKERQEILDRFLSVNPQESFRMNIRIRHTTTGLWLTETDEFIEWMNGSDLHLWLTGIPGAGKTILSSLIIQQCMNQATNERAVAFFYCDYKSSSSQDLIRILSSLASQLSRQHENCFELLKAYDSRLRPEKQPQRSPEVEELISLLKEMSDVFEDVRLIVDGLDECNEHAGRVADTLRLLGDGHATISMCLLSRDEVDIREKLQPPTFKPIEIAAHTGDIELYVRAEIEERKRNNRLRIKSNDLKDEIISQLVSRANGMFRWVSCQLDELCELPTDALRRKALTRLPPTLNETYARILIRLKDSARPLIRRALQWITYANRQLTVEELIEIVSIDENDEVLDTEAYPDLEDLLRYCGSLVRRTGQSLELAHFTVQEFLETIKPEDTVLNEFRLSTTDTLTLAKTCVNYLYFSSFDHPPSPRYMDYPEDHAFYGYASAHLPQYVAQYAHEEDLQRHLQKLFDPNKSFNLTRFIIQHVRSRPDNWYTLRNRLDKVCSHEFGSLHAAAMLHFGNVCRWLVEQGCDVNQKSALGVPLECAVYGTPYIFGSLNALWKPAHLYSEEAQQTILTLLEVGAVWDVEEKHDMSLSHAILLGLTKFLTKMLRLGMPLRVKDFEGNKFNHVGFPKKEFLRAIDDGIEKAETSLDVRMQLLRLAQAEHVSIKASVSSDEAIFDGDFLKVVVHTVKFGPVSALQRFLSDDRFLVIMKDPKQPGMLLRAAVDHNSPQCLKLLLEKQLDPAQLDARGRTLLHHAIISYKVDLELLRQLVECNIAEVADPDGCNAWHIAAAYHRLDVLDLLISHYGPDHPSSYARNGEGHSPLLMAILSKDGDAASRILRSVSPEKTFLTNPRFLHTIVAMGLEDTLQEIVDMGADLHAVSDENQNALYFITNATSLEMVELLLSYKLDVNHLDSYGRSPFLDLLEAEHRSKRSQTWKSLIRGCIGVPALAFTKLGTTFSATTRDIMGHSAWLYFCAKTIARFICNQEGFDDDSVPPGAYLQDHAVLEDTYSVLVQLGAFKAYEEATTKSGLGLLIEACINVTSQIEPTRASTIIRLYIALFLLNALETTKETNLTSAHPQVVQLLIWSMSHGLVEIFEKLLQFGVNVHASSHAYNGASAVDIFLVKDVSWYHSNLLLAHAQSHRILRLQANGDLNHFVLCSSPSFTWDAERNRKKLEAILKKGVDPNAVSANHYTAAHVAAGSGDFEGIKVLVAHHADLLLKDKQGRTVIHHAVGRGQINVLTYLRQLIQGDDEWKRPAAISVSSIGPQRIPLGPLAFSQYFRCTLTHLAAYTSSSDSLQFLQENNILADVNARTQEGVCPLHFAACLDSPDTTKWLLKNGANVNIRCGIREISALHIALKWGRLDNAISLIEAGADFSADSAGVTPEMQTHPNIRADLISLLPHVGVQIPPAVISVIQRDHGRQSLGSLYTAIVNGDLKACGSIVADEPSWESSFKECGACTPLIVALAHQKLGIVEMLLDHGASTSGTPCAQIKRLTPGVSAIEIAIQRQLFNPILEDLLEVCLSHEGHWSQRCSYWRPLHLAAAFNPRAIDILVEHFHNNIVLFRNTLQCTVSDANPSTLLKVVLESHAIDYPFAPIPGLVPGGTALHVAVFQGRQDAVEILLRLGVNVNLKSMAGTTPLHDAARFEKLL